MGKSYNTDKRDKYNKYKRIKRSKDTYKNRNKYSGEYSEDI